MASRFTRRALLSAGAGGALSAWTCGRGRSATPGALEKSKLVAAIPVDAASFLPIYLAALRTWKEQGLDIELTAFRGDAEVSQALVGGSVDFSVQSADGLINMLVANQPVIAFYAAHLRTADVFVPLVILVVIGILINSLGNALEARLQAWKA